MADAAQPKNSPVSKTVMTLTMVHPVELDPAAMSQEDIAYHMGDGEFVGARTAIETMPLSDKEVVSELQALGNDGTFFERQAEPSVPGVSEGQNA